jgi:hypothetical protein
MPTNMSTTHIDIFDKSGILKPITDEHMSITPTLSRRDRYIAMSVEELVGCCREGSYTTVDLLMELHRRAAVSVFRHKRLYNWDCVPVELDKHGVDHQAERARMIMTYDCKWKSSRAPDNPSILDYGTLDPLIETINDRVRRIVNEKMAQLKAEAREAAIIRHPSSPLYKGPKPTLTVRNVDEILGDSE